MHAGFGRGHSETDGRKLARRRVPTLPHEALEIVVKHREAMRGLPGEVASQLQRASVSVVANIAEGFGRYTGRDRQNRWAIARAEANEAGAMVEIARLYGVFADADYRALRQRLLRVTWMLTAMLRR